MEEPTFVSLHELPPSESCCPCCCKSDDRMLHRNALLAFNAIATVTALVAAVSIPIDLLAFFWVTEMTGLLWIAGVLALIAGVCGLAPERNRSAILVFSAMAGIFSLLAVLLDVFNQRAMYWDGFTELYLTTITIDTLRLACVLTLLLVAYFEAWVPSVFRDRDDEAAASQSATLAENARANNEESETILV